MNGIKLFIDRIGIKQNELAERLSVTSTAVSYWITGKRDVPNDKLRLILLMGATIDELFDIDYATIQAKFSKNQTELPADKYFEMEKRIKLLESAILNRDSLDQSKAG